MSLSIMGDGKKEDRYGPRDMMIMIRGDGMKWCNRNDMIDRDKNEDANVDHAHAFRLLGCKECIGNTYREIQDG